jgi:hypothetical protein
MLHRESITTFIQLNIDLVNCACIQHWLNVLYIE